MYVYIHLIRLLHGKWCRKYLIASEGENRLQFVYMCKEG